VQSPTTEFASNLKSERKLNLYPDLTGTSKNESSQSKFIIDQDSAKYTVEEQYFRQQFSKKNPDTFGIYSTVNDLRHDMFSSKKMSKRYNMTPMIY
jgi:hypothetical protein